MTHALAALRYDDVAERREFFHQMVLNGLIYWQEHPAVQSLDVPTLDFERDGILNALNRGLEYDKAWPHALKLIDELAAYMERRGFWSVWRGVLEKAVVASQRVGDIQGETTLTALLARVSQRQSRGEDVVRYYRRVIQLAKQSDNQYEYARACCNLGYYFIDAGRLWRSEVLSLQALDVFERLGSLHGRAHSHNHLGFLYRQQSRWDESYQHLKLAVNIWRANDDNYSLIAGLINLGGLHNLRNTPQEAIIVLDEALHLATKTGEKSFMGTILHELSIAHRQCENYAEAEQLALQAEKSHVKYNDDLGLARVWHNLTLIQLQKGNDSKSRAYFERSMQMYRQLNYDYGVEQLGADMDKF